MPLLNCYWKIRVALEMADVLYVLYRTKEKEEEPATTPAAAAAGKTNCTKSSLLYRRHNR